MQQGVDHFPTDIPPGSRISASPFITKRDGMQLSVMPLVQLGTVTTRSGVLILIDTGYLGLWSHDRIPTLPEGSLSDEESTATANSFIDLRIVGADAEHAGRLLDMSWNPLYVYDQPPTNPELQSKFNRVVAEHKLDASFEVVNPRIPH